MTRRIRLGISTCPNDTFAFHALLAGEVDARGLEFETTFADVQELNEGLLAGEFDACKVSYFAALLAADRVAMLPAGSALGFGVGPLLLAREEAATDDGRLVLCPGEWTTAHLLYRIFHPGAGRVEQRVFSEIMPALVAGSADLGVCIHEGRFTYEQHGLLCLEDLGDTWERATKTPLPLGGIAVAKSLGPEVASPLGHALADSIDWAHRNRQACLPTMKEHALELSDEVLWKHVELYVNDWTRDLGEIGRTAVAELSKRARAAGLLTGPFELEVA